MFLLIIKIKSKNKNSLKNFTKLINKLATKTNLKLMFINLLNKKNNNKNFSVLTSPNANKNAQEQFLFKTYSKHVSTFAFKTQKLLLFLKKIKLILFADIKIKLRFFLSKKIIKQNVLKSLDPENFNLKLCSLKKNILKNKNNNKRKTPLKKHFF